MTILTPEREAPAVALAGVTAIGRRRETGDMSPAGLQDRRNLAARRDAGNYVSDADEAYYAQAQRTSEPPTEIDAAHILRDDGQSDFEDVLDQVVGRLAAMRTTS